MSVKVWSILFLSLCLWWLGCSLVYTIDAVFTLSGHPLSIEIPQKVDVVTYATPLCALLKSPDDCVNAIDDLFRQMHAPVHYAPRVNSRTAEDFTLTRVNVILELIHRYNYTSYLEIGCFMDEVFSVVRNTVSFAVGVDPIQGGTHRMLSDTFFDQNDETFDLIFVDGDHTAEQTFIDVVHALQVLRPGGTIVMHDCNPHTESHQILGAHVYYAYNGDVWKVIPYLRSLEDVEVVTVDIDHGVGVIRMRENTHPLPPNLLLKLDESLHQPLAAYTYREFDENREELLRLVSIAEFRAWLDEEN